MARRRLGDGVRSVSHLGIGIDLVDVPRIASMLEDKGELAFKRLLTDGEREYCLGRASRPRKRHSRP
jgi:phosphopantetheinyl transferase (holo-ACP synthase)